MRVVRERHKDTELKKRNVINMKHGSETFCGEHFLLYNFNQRK